MIDTGRLLLRRVTPDDVKDISEFAAQPTLARVLTDSPPAHEEGVRAWVEKQNAHPFGTLDVYLDLAIELKDEHKVIGLIGLIVRANRQGEMGWAVHTGYQRQGIATEAAAALMAYGFSELNLHRIHAATDSPNIGSWKLMERLGMRREAVLKEACVFEGHWCDRYGYALLASEWRDRN